jgi:hypothetical protein
MQLAVQIVRFIDESPQPGIVACEFVDAEDRAHTFIDKVPIFSSAALDERSSYPLAGVVRCKVLATWGDAGRELARISTDRDGVESTTGLSEFVVTKKTTF